LSSAIASAGRQPVWRYYYEGDFKNARLTPHAGAYHTAEIPMIFGTYPRANATQTQKDLSTYMQSTWAGFVKDPYAGPGWPQLGSTWNGHELGVLGGEDAPSGESTELMIHADLACIIMDPLLVAQRSAW
jgi:carboxylesterase type B